jgi:ATP-dependent 26S proteasome regulatory subunit
LEERTKKLVKALIEVRISAERMEDVIEGKGNGLIMLLHGSPGTGKTLTAGTFLYILRHPLLITKIERSVI